MIRVGILGSAGYTGGELIRLLLNHPDAEIVFANSGSNACNPVSSVHEGLLGDTDLRFCDATPFDDVDVVFFCFGHGKSAEYLGSHDIPSRVKIIDLAQDFRLKNVVHDFVYGLPELHKFEIARCRHLANPGCFATCIQLGLLPLASRCLLTHDVSINAITGSTGAGQKPVASTHFSWRNNNMSIYKVFTHQHLHEIGSAVERTIRGAGFAPIVNLCGHQIARNQLHAGFSVPNYDNGDDTKIQSGMTVAIEPFATNGKGQIKNGKPGNIVRIIKHGRKHMFSR